MDLNSEIELIKYQLLLLKNNNDVADLLGVHRQKFLYFIFRFEYDKYTNFTLKNKRNGKNREISAPIKPLKNLQKKLNDIFSIIYNHHECAHGFIKERSIITNAAMHVNKKYVLNIDIKDFFPSIHFGRVKGLFKSKPFNFNNKIATTLAHICCYDGKLPQGAPTSPFISNVICRKLDNDLRRLAKKYRCTYSRFADDITFSTTANKFPKELAQIAFKEGLYTIELGSEIESIFEKNGFEINFKKVRLTNKLSRQEVTGLCVNKKVNIKRKFIREVRAMLHNWERDGELQSEQRLHQEYYFKHYNPEKDPPKFRTVLRGKIEYIKMVRGSDDQIYRKFINKYFDLTNNPEKKLPIGPIEKINTNLWVLECDDCQRQGSAFMIADGILITCYHVLGPETKAFKYDDVAKKYDVTILTKHHDLDIAVLRIDANTSDAFILSGEKPGIGNDVIIAGFPRYWWGDSPNIRYTKISAIRRHRTLDNYVLAQAIIKGDSGCPLMNADGEVIGICSRGAEDFDDTQEVSDNRVIPLIALKNLKNIEQYINLEFLN